ncbi:ras GEF [Phellopilus nigrolimitatus]|nr:ras GEF [Phellopilus nigrolimitatus]
MSSHDSDSVLPEESASQPRLSVATTAEDAFPDFSDPKLFSGSANSPTSASSDAASDFEAHSEISSNASSVASPVLTNTSSAASSGSRFLLPLPTPSANRSQTSFALSEVSDIGGLDGLPPEIAAADISISADGSFVETTSGPAARELKHRYDQQLGVSKAVRSPYIITAIINQHGKQVYRVGMRSQAQAQDPTPELEPQPTASGSGTASQARRKRRSRMSITSVFKSTTAPSQRAPEDSRGSPVSTSASIGPRKLRKPRSIPDLTSAASGYFGDTAGSQTSMTGRAHSHSVTGADMPRPIVRASVVTEASPRPSGDVFSNVMGWAAAPPSPMTSSGMTPSSRSLLTPSTPSESPLENCSQHSKEVIEHPFGRNVLFDSPFRNSAIYLPSMLREMQSFESAKTARADTQTRSPAEETPQRPDSLDSLASTKSATDSMSDSQSEHNSATAKSVPHAAPSQESCMYTRYPTSVFDVIQNYHGLPMLDSLSADSRQPTIKMSLSALDGAVPRDDPRFVIWGDVSADDGAGAAEKASLHESASAQSRPHSHTFSSSHSRKRSLRGAPPEVREPSPERRGADDATSSVDDPDGARRVLMAATIERWIAQLTSQFDYDELLIFFLTYRTYIDAMDLCHLLICRFHWALEEPATPHEVMVKQIVRVRTFVAIRYWLLTFFRIDFLPNRELCIIFANWLNTLWRDPILDKYNDARNIVKKLKKVAKDCKDAHSRQSKSSSGSEKKGKVMQSIDKILGDLSNGVNFAATLRKVSAAQHEEEDSDVDLDFNPEESSPFSDVAGIQGFTSFANQLGPGDNASNKSPVTSVTTSPTRPTNSTSRILLQQPLHLTILQHARAIQPGTHLPLAGTTSALPVHHSSLSRVVVNTIGRLGRWKRVLSSRSPATPLTPYGDVSAFDLELNATGDLFAVRGGVEQYLKMIDPVASSPVTPSAPDIPKVTVSVSSGDGEDESSPSSPLPTPSPQDTEPASRTPLASHADLRPESPGLKDDNSRSQTPGSEAHGPVHRTLSRVRSTERAESVGSGSSGSMRSFETTSFLGNPITNGQFQSFPDVVSIDDLDFLSDDSSRESGPTRATGLRPTKRLPNRRDFEFVRRSVDSVSSMGIMSRASVAMSEQVDSARSSFSSPRGLGNAVEQWQVNALVDDLSDNEREDPGDAEAALRRLEGQINPRQQRQKQAKIDGWVRTIQERMAAGDFGVEQPRFLSDDEGDGSDSEDDYGTESGAMDSLANEEDVTASLPRSSEDSLQSFSHDLKVDKGENVGGEAVTPTPRQTTHPINSPGTQSLHTPASDAKPKVDEAVPEEILLSRLPSRPSTSGGTPVKSPTAQRNGQTTFLLAKHPNNPAPYRSFILHYRSGTLAQHFAVIEREIFLGIKFEELVSEEWMSSAEEYNIRDWMQFLRDRRRKVELRGVKMSVLSAARARFNLVANFVVSEIALTNPHDRVYIVSKFIRIAWKAYTQNNFATLVAIISGLSSESVRKAMKRSWSRVGIWEIRVFDDLKAFCTSDNDFRYIRRAIAAIVDAKPLNTGGQDDAATTSTADGASSSTKNKGASDGKVVVPTSCVPFIGVYMSQLHRFSRLPDLIDPSAPTETVDTDPGTGNFKSPAHPEVFSDLRPLPPSMQIEPLINVQKQRKIAGVIKSLVAGQHLANKVEVDVDKKLLSRCLKLSALDVEALQRIFAVYTDY